MAKIKTLNSIAILMPGDMGHGCATVFRQNGLRVITCLARRRQRTKALAKKSGHEDLHSLTELVKTQI
ncbi:hypothetical protein N8500_05415 [Candidatus Puniceispirillum sp.]|nr:hypothetical protein [Candidatus Puniceispirillum sp.]